jgi:pSer/pThr/pTyr-binding forkhead associated (FHA) protein
MDIVFVLWVITFALFCIVVIQVFYLVFLSYIPTRRTQSRRTEAAAPAPSRSVATNQMSSTNPLLGTNGASSVNILTPVPASMSRVPPTTNPNLRAASPPRPAPAAPPPTPTMLGEAPAASSLISEVGKLVVLSGLPDQLEVNLPGMEFGIGRFYNQERKILVVLDEKSISREHAFFQYNPQIEQYFLTDKSSSYGTYILANNQFDPLTAEQPQQIFNGDVVQFGNLVKVRFILAGGTRASVTQL